MKRSCLQHQFSKILLALCLVSIPLEIMLFFPPLPRAHAAGPFTVNDLGDADQAIPGDPVCETAPGNNICTLRAAIEEANFFPGADTINITVTGTIVLTNTLPSISQDLTINGPGATNLTISGANSYLVLQVNGVNLTLSGVTIANGNSGSGGGIFNFLGTVNISGTTFNNNRAPSFNGGGIYSVNGTLNITNSIFYSNTVSGSGGGIYSNGTIVNLTNSSIYSNTASSTGGGIYQTGGALFITNSAIYSNTSPSTGGAIYLNSSVLNLAGGSVYSNTASSDGGGIYLNSSALFLTSSSVYSNTAIFANGGAIYNNNGTLFVTNSAITSNVAISSTRSNGLGGGIYNYGFLSIGNSTLSNNSAGSLGGAIYVITSTATITNSTFSGNNAGAGFGGGIILGTSAMQLDSTTLYGNSASAAGAISNFGILTITNSTVYSNTGTNGAGGIMNVGILTMTNSTITGNRAVSGPGGGIANGFFPCFDCVITVTNSTIASNSANTGGGIANDIGVTMTLTNTIVANNSAGTGANCSGTITDGGKNLQWNPSSSCGFALAAGDPKLAPLGNYGGPTKTMALFLGSKAIDAGDDSACPPTDQRGVTRWQGAHCDIGAFEGTEYPLYLPIILK